MARTHKSIRKHDADRKAFIAWTFEKELELRERRLGYPTSDDFRPRLRRQYHELVRGSRFTPVSWMTGLYSDCGMLGVLKHIGIKDALVAWKRAEIAWIAARKKATRAERDARSRGGCGCRTRQHRGWLGKRCLTPPISSLPIAWPASRVPGAYAPPRL